MADEAELAKAPAMLFYALILAVAIGFFLGPLAGYIIWRIRRDDPFLDFHGRQSLDILATMLLFGGTTYLAGLLLMERSPVAGAVLQYASVGVVLLQAALTVWGMVAAGRGERRPLPLTLMWLRRQTSGEASHAE